MASRFEKFSERARRVLSLAQEEAQRFNHNYIGTEHILLGLVRETDGVAARVLSNLSVELSKVRSAVEFIIGRGERSASGEIGLTPRAKKVIELTVDEARRLDDHYIGTEHLLIGLIREGKGVAAGVLESLGVSLDKVRAVQMAVKKKPRTIRDLHKSGYQVLPIREELRRNLVKRLRNKETLFPKIVGFEDTVVPQIQNAILAGQDIVLLGERGQAKSRIIRSLTTLLDDEIPVIAGCEINDNPFAPVCRACRDKCHEMGDEVEIAWLQRDDRYGEKLATPDISMADLIGEADPIRVAEGRYLSDELTIHYGLIPRTNRGIFSINELPDLAERIQVGLFNLMEERDIQIKGYRIRLPLDVYIVATANPEDYTNRGRIITPLKDRYGSHIRTHYPRAIEEEIDIVEQERANLGEIEEMVTVPQYMKEIIAEITALARRSPDINQRSGVSVRVSIANFETAMSNSARRAFLHGEKSSAPRISDLSFILPSSSGKIELETVEEGREPRIIEDLIKKAVLNVFSRYFNVRDLETLILRFDEGAVMETGNEIPSREYAKAGRSLAGLSDALTRLESDGSPELVASGTEFILEGLHLNRRLNRDRVEGRFRYRA